MGLIRLLMISRFPNYALELVRYSTIGPYCRVTIRVHKFKPMTVNDWFYVVKYRIKDRGINVERTLVRTAIYSFITAFSLLLIFIQRVRLTTDLGGMGSYEAKSYPDFFFMILRYSIIITFIMVIFVFLYKRYKK